MKQYIAISAVVCMLVSCASKQTHGLNTKASVQVTDQLPENPLLLHAITTSILPADSAMRMLYGNDTAFAYATRNSDQRYPTGAVLYQVTWKQQPDAQWAGANIPAGINTVERVAFAADGKPVYTLYKGSPLKVVPAAAADSLHVKAMLAQRMAVAP